MFSRFRAWLAQKWFDLRLWWYVRRGVNLNTWPRGPDRPKPRIGIGVGPSAPPPPKTKEQKEAEKAAALKGYEDAMNADGNGICGIIPFPKRDEVNEVLNGAREIATKLLQMPEADRNREMDRISREHPSTYQLIRSEMAHLRRQAQGLVV